MIVIVKIEMMMQIIQLGNKIFFCKKINDLMIILNVFIRGLSVFPGSISEQQERSLSTKIRPTDTADITIK